MNVQLMQGPSISGVCIDGKLYTKEEALQIAARIVLLADGHLSRETNERGVVAWNTDSAFFAEYMRLLV